MPGINLLRPKKQKKTLRVFKPEYIQILIDVIKMRLEEESVSQSIFAKQIGVSPSCVSEFFSGKTEPSLKVERNISRVLHIDPAVIPGI